jgi:parallel beta-helix repeat protein
MLRAITIACLLIMVELPSAATATVLSSDTVWAGEVIVSEDILVPAGVTLAVMPGTTIRMAISDSTKMEPEYMSPLTEITVRGKLTAEGTKEAPVSFLGAEGEGTAGWSGIIIDGGTVQLRSCVIQNAETGVYVLKGALLAEDSVIRNNHYGLVAGGKGVKAIIRDSLVTGNDYGVLSLNGADTDTSGSVIRENRKKDTHSSIAREFRHALKEYREDDGEPARSYGDEVLLTDTIWRGSIEVNGIIRVPERVRLIVAPGTVIEFKKKDTNGDGIGENGLLIQGLLIAKGTSERPIIFRSAEKNKAPGDWDAINIMSSSGAQNLVEYCQIENAYRALHFHFARVLVNGAVLRNNYRGIQFQESVVEIKGSSLYGNRSGVRARDSEILLEDNDVSGNYRGVDLFRDNLTARGNRIMNNLMEGVKVREGVAIFKGNFIDGNRYGLMVTDSYYGNFDANVLSNNEETGFSMKNMGNIEVLANYISGNGFNGISLQDVGAVIKGNQLTGNRERGIGIISFDGVITGNNLANNGLYAIGLEGPGDVSAPVNWWGGEDIEKVIYDRTDEPSRGRVIHQKESEGPFPYSWPSSTVPADITWVGNIVVQGAVIVSPGSTLMILPKTRVEFSGGSGLVVRGKIIATGEHDGKITFTSLKKIGPSDWDELLLDSANGSEISHSVFEYATWGIHSHFTALSVKDTHFRKNYGGMRFMSGPVEVKHSRFEENYIGMRSYKGQALITENVVTGNEIGIFVREKGSGLTVTKNNIFANSRYNIRVGDANDEDVNAQENWWGYGNPAETIFDGRTEPGIGKVNYEPFLKEPFKTALPEDK